MAREHDTLRRVIRPSAQAQPEDWHVVLDAAHRVCAARSDESERLLREILDLEGPLSVSARHIPHAMPAADMLRSLAIQTLARWDLGRHRAAIERVRDTTRSDLLAAMARAHL